MFYDGWTNVNNKESSGQPSLVTGKLKAKIKKIGFSKTIVTKRMCVVYYLWIVCFLSFILHSLLCIRLSKLRVDPRIQQYLSIKQDVLSHFIINLSYLSVDCDHSEFVCNKKINKTRYLTHGRILRSHYSYQLERFGCARLHCVADQNILHLPNGPKLLRTTLFSLKVISFSLLTILVISFKGYLSKVKIKCTVSFLVNLKGYDSKARD